jgi:hypothetical protein
MMGNLSESSYHDVFLYPIAGKFRIDIVEKKCTARTETHWTSKTRVYIQIIVGFE